MHVLVGGMPAKLDCPPNVAVAAVDAKPGHVVLVAEGHGCDFLTPA